MDSSVQGGINNTGTNPDEVSAELVSFLQYTKKPLPESEDELDDPFIRRLQGTIHQIKKSRTMEEKFMQFQEMLQEEYEQGREEGRQVFAFDMILAGYLSIEAAATELGMDLGVLKEKLDEYSTAKNGIE